MRKRNPDLFYVGTGVPVLGSLFLSGANDYFLQNGDSALKLRDVLPEPLDYFDHVESVAASWAAGYTLTYVVAKGLKRWGSEEAKSRAGKLATSVAVGAVAALNAAVEITEIRYGMHGAVTGIIDGGYGLGGAALGAASADVEKIVSRPTPHSEEGAIPPPPPPQVG